MPNADCAADSLVTGVGAGGLTCPKSGLVALAPDRRCRLDDWPALELNALEPDRALASDSPLPPLRLPGNGGLSDGNSPLAEDAEDEGDISFSWLILEDIEVLRKVNCAIGLSVKRRVYKAPCSAKGEIDEMVVAMIVSIPILSSFSTRRIPVRPFLSERESTGFGRFFLDCAAVAGGSWLKVRFNNSAPLLNNPSERVLPGGGGGDVDRVGGGLASGLLHGVAVGVKFRSPVGVATQDGVPTHDGVTALIPLSFNILASPSVVENVDVELRRLSVRGVLMPEFIPLLGAVATRLPTMLGVTLV